MYVFFNNVFFLKIYNLFTKAYEGPQQPTTANEGQRRPAAAHGRPTQAHEGSQHPTTIGMFFLIMYCFLNLQLIHAGPQRQKKSPRGPTAANEGRRRPTKRDKRPKRRVWRRLGCLGPYYFNVFFLNLQLMCK